MTAAQQLVQRGVQQGLQQGMQTRSLEIAKNMFSQLHLDTATIQRVTGLSKQELERIRAASKGKK